MRSLFDAPPLFVKHQYRVVDEFVGLGLARHHLAQTAIDILDDEIDGIGRQAPGTEEDIEHAFIGVHRSGVLEVTVIAPVKIGAERQQCIGRQDQSDRQADGLKQHADRARLDHFHPPPPPAGFGLAQARRRGNLTDRVLTMSSEGCASPFGRIVQHVS